MGQLKVQIQEWKMQRDQKSRGGNWKMQKRKYREFSARVENA